MLVRFPYKLVALDLDGTLLGPDKRISAENIAAVRELLRLGVRVVLASGRPHHNVLPYHRELGLAGPIVGGNGATVWVPETDDFWSVTLLDADLAWEVAEEGRRIGITQIWDAPDGMWALERTLWIEVLESRIHEAVPTRPAPRGVSPYKILWIDDERTVAERETFYREKWGARSYVVCTDPEYLEFCPPGIDKSVGLQEVCRRFGLTSADVLAMGDGDNDVEMLRWAGLGLTPPHGRVKAKEAADGIIPDGPPETAVARAIRQLLQR